MTAMPIHDPTPSLPAATEATRPPRRRASPWSTGDGKSPAGSVWQYQPKTGRVVWRIRYRDAAGRRILETLGPEPTWTRRRAQAELRARLVEIERDHYQRPTHTTFAQFATEWMQTAVPARSLKHSTTENYHSTLRRHLIPAFGHLTLEDLEADPRLIDGYIAQKLRSGLSPKTVTNHLVLLQVMLKQAVRWRLIRHNPLPDTTRPRVPQPHINILTVDEITQLRHAYDRLETEAETPEQAEWWRLAHTITLFTLATAVRAGELIALQWGDVSLLDGTIHIRRAIVRSRPTTPKSRAGTRTIHLGPQTIQLLTTHYEQSQHRGDTDPVFPHPQLGTTLDPSALARRHLKPALRAAGITKAFRAFHDLRHTSLTHDAAAGNPHTYIQHKAGHAQGSITERYIHAAQSHFPNAPGLAEARMFPRRTVDPFGA
jgi:integrase